MMQTELMTAHPQGPVNYAYCSQDLATGLAGRLPQMDDDKVDHLFKSLEGLSSRAQKKPSTPRDKTAQEHDEIAWLSRIDSPEVLRGGLGPIFGLLFVSVLGPISSLVC